MSILSALMICLAAPVAAPEPAGYAYFAKVDIIVINRVRTRSVSFDEWGRPKVRFSEQWWISFWDIVWMPLIPGRGATPIALIDRGWWASSNMRVVAPCSDGWLVESKDGMNVVARELWIIDSPFDWEVKNRKIYRPIRKPK